MTRTATAAFIAALLFPAVVLAQSAASAQPPPAKALKAPIPSRIWIAAGAGYAAERTGCPECPEDGVYADSYSFILDAGLSVNRRVDVGMELMWVDLNVDGASHVSTLFVLGVAQFRPWAEHGFFLRAAMGLGIAGNGLYNPNGPPLPKPYTTNGFAIAYGVGWEQKLNSRWGLQAYGMQHVAGLGELTMENATLKNVVVNYWTVGGGIVFRR